MFSILPFEVPFFEQKHHYPIHYVGNPTADEVGAFQAEYTESTLQFCKRNGLDDKPIIALLAGSRRSEIRDNLPRMMRVMPLFNEYQFVLAGAPSIDSEFYRPFIEGSDVRLLHGQTFELLSHATAALVTSGTATLETALFNVPQVVCYCLPMARVYGFLRRWLIKVRYVSLVNLIAGREVVPELVLEAFSHERLVKCLGDILPGGTGRAEMLAGYDEVRHAIGKPNAPANAAKLIVELAE